MTTTRRTTITLMVASVLITGVVALAQQQKAYASHEALHISYQDINGGNSTGTHNRGDCLPDGSERIVVSMSFVRIPFDGDVTLIVDGEVAGDPVPQTAGNSGHKTVFGAVPPSEPGSAHEIWLRLEATDGSGQVAEGFHLPYTYRCAPEKPADTTAPVISGADDITVEISRSEEGAEVQFDVSAQDEVDGVVDVTCTPESDSTFSIGETTVTCTATDAAGNEETASFTVTVSYRPLTEEFSNGGLCISEANTNPDAGFTREDCQDAFRAERGNNGNGNGNGNDNNEEEAPPEEGGNV